MLQPKRASASLAEGKVDQGCRSQIDLDQSMVHNCRPDVGSIRQMRVPVSEAKGQLTELVRRAEAGDEVILTRHGHAVARLVPTRPAADPVARRRLLDAVRAAGAAKATPGPVAARSQDFLYDEDGLPR
jgi:prevent-host-death family protein